MAGMVQRHKREGGRDDGSCCGTDRGGLDRYGPCNGFSSVPTRPKNMALVSAEVRIGNTETRLEAARGCVILQSRKKDPRSPALSFGHSKCNYASSADKRGQYVTGEARSAPAHSHSAAVRVLARGASGNDNGGGKNVILRFIFPDYRHRRRRPRSTYSLAPSTPSLATRPRRPSSPTTCTPSRRPSFYDGVSGRRNARNRR